jgi:uncharacterized protein (TIGR02284 family)
MKQHDEKIVAALNRLIESCKDSRDSYRAVARRIRDAELKARLKASARQRATFAGELQTEVRRQGGRPARSGTITATLLRWLMLFKATLLGRSESALLAECERAEAQAMRHYDDASHLVLPSDLQALVAQQYHEIKEARQHLEELKHRPVHAPMHA